MAHKKGVGSSRNGRDSNPQMLGVKEYGGELVKPGSIIVRQRGSKFDPGKNVGMGRDYTLYSLIDGYVTFEGKKKGNRRVSVYPENPHATGAKASLTTGEVDAVVASSEAAVTATPILPSVAATA